MNEIKQIDDLPSERINAAIDEAVAVMPGLDAGGISSIKLDGRRIYWSSRNGHRIITQIDASEARNHPENFRRHMQTVQAVKDAEWVAFLQAEADEEEPPPVAEMLLMLVLPPKRREAILGDMEECFQLDRSEMTIGRARRRYWWRALRSFLPLASHALRKLRGLALLEAARKILLG